MKRILIFLMVICASFSTTVLVGASEVSAAVIKESTDDSEGCNRKNFLGFVPWYRGLTTKSKGGSCDVGTPDGNDGLTQYVITIVLNVLDDLLLAVGYFLIGFLIYGGYLYLTAEGDVGKLTKAKRTITAAVIGTAIALLASVIIDFIVGALTSTGA